MKHLLVLLFIILLSVESSRLKLTLKSTLGLRKKNLKSVFSLYQSQKNKLAAFQNMRFQQVQGIINQQKKDLETQSKNIINAKKQNFFTQLNRQAQKLIQKKAIENEPKFSEKSNEAIEPATRSEETKTFGVDDNLLEISKDARVKVDDFNLSLEQLQQLLVLDSKIFEICGPRLTKCLNVGGQVALHNSKFDAFQLLATVKKLKSDQTLKEQVRFSEEKETKKEENTASAKSQVSTASTAVSTATTNVPKPAIAENTTNDFQKDLEAEYGFHDDDADANANEDLEKQVIAMLDD